MIARGNALLSAVTEKMTYKQYLEQIPNAQYYNHTWRLGQAYFNVLRDVRPDIAKRVQGKTGLDPFYRDELVSTFLKFVEENW